ncbi:hypothetical protein HMPREF9318_00727 [Streptococcus urinalis FB127-CNA-2]|uniref:Uncharacterized protein n=1 Tax=Streptococcus urinalis 2285-97 TaxID=764291 RepID=G5KHH2_9STRE|nr:anti sigma factor C-terminal domain-containing protein [Streptococcus urinalis]EHJ55957.1 hypothetical protein STRUR_1487 [Streptococcus urinalis 2285-97]EKS22529.1 hypothetical protein HMPREF9318_00727 [Streptococcus urinalis FB127-CNA-2]VEF32342.1 membrane protein [Streptococcus urinalis]
MKISTNFEEIAKKSKRRSLVKTIIISSLVSIVIIGLLVKAMSYMTSENGNKVKSHYLLMSEIAYPNITSSNWTFQPLSIFTGQFKADRFKNIDGISVPYEKMEANYSLTKSDLTDTNVWLKTGDNDKSEYTQSTNIKSPVFYNPNVNQKNPNNKKKTNDISLLSKMSGKAVEVAVTFDKPYTVDQISKMVPNNLLINWYWIGSKSHYDLSGLTPDNQLGISLQDSKKMSQYDLTLFRENLKSALDKNYLKSEYGTDTTKMTSSSFNLSSDAKEFLKANQSLKTAKFSGVILTGKSENFSTLTGKSWIYASNIGTSVDIQPYHQLTR